MCENIKETFKTPKSKRNRQYTKIYENGEKANNSLRNTSWKTTDLVTQTRLKTGGYQVLRKLSRSWYLVMMIALTNITRQQLHDANYPKTYKRQLTVFRYV